MAAARSMKPRYYPLFRYLFSPKKNLSLLSALCGGCLLLYLLVLSIYNFIEYAPPESDFMMRRDSRVGDTSDAADYISSTVKRDALPEQLAFFLQIQRSTLHLLPRLLNRIYHAGNIYVVHFDTDVRPAEGIRWLLRANVSYMYPNRLPRNVKVMRSETVNYMGISMTLNTINAMQVALDFSSNWRYFINISGNDYPLVSPAVMRNLLSHKGRSREFFCFKPMKRKFWHRFSFFSLDSALDFRNIERPVGEWFVPNPLVFYSRGSIHKAEAWMILSREFARFVTHSSFARRILLLFSYSIMSDEMYFATLARNTLFDTRSVNNCMRQIEWYDDGRVSGQHPYFMDDLFDTGHFTTREKLGNYTALFGRKFRRTSSPYMDYIDATRDSNATLARVGKHFRGQLQGRRRKRRNGKLRTAVIR